MNPIKQIASGTAAVFLRTIHFHALAEKAAAHALGSDASAGPGALNACAPTLPPSVLPVVRQ